MHICFISKYYCARMMLLGDFVQKLNSLNSKGEMVS